MKNQGPLVIDLDGTLIKTDVLVEQALSFAISSPIAILQLAWWTLRGRPCLKSNLAIKNSVDLTALPFRQPVLDLIKKEKESGRKIFLATATHQIAAKTIAEHLGLFDEILATTDKTNLKGNKKLSALMEKIGSNEFTYVGDSKMDLPIWKECKNAILVNPSTKLEKKVKSWNIAYSVINDPVSPLKKAIQAIRFPHWSKNLLVFLPIIGAHKVFSFMEFKASLMAFFSLSLCASAGYLVNDLADLDSDRRHASKNKRPFASGDLSLIAGVGLFSLLLLGAILIGVMLPMTFFLFLLVYLFLTVGYSITLKKWLLIDVICLASFFTIRIFAGSAASGVPVSGWLATFSLFIFFSLALLKRYSEFLGTKEKTGLKRRDYHPEDKVPILALGVGSGIMTPLIFSLYMSSPTVAALYTNPGRMWIVGPLLLYWICRMWILAHRGEVKEDPIVFFLKDGVSYAIAAIILCVMAVAA